MIFLKHINPKKLKVKKIYKYRMFDYTRMNDEELMAEFENRCNMAEKLPDTFTFDAIHQVTHLLLHLHEMIKVIKDRFPDLVNEVETEHKLKDLLKKLNIDSDLDGKSD